MQNTNLTALAALRKLRESANNSKPVPDTRPKLLELPDHFIVIKSEKD